MLTGVIESISAELPDLAADPEMSAALDAACRTGLRAVVRSVAAGMQELRLPEETLALPRTLARRGLGIEPVVQGFGAVRQATLRIFNDLSEVLGDEAGIGKDLVPTWSFILRWTDTGMEILLAEHARERDLLVQSRTAHRMDAVRALLAADQVDVDELSDVLSYPLRRHHTAFVGWTAGAQSGAAAGRQSSSALAAWLSQRFDGQVLVVPSGLTTAWAWLATSREPDFVPDDLLRLPGGAVVAIGTTAYGPAGFRSSHQEAMAAQSILRARGMGEGVHFYDDIELPGLVGANPEGMRALVRRELRGLAVDDPTGAKVRATLLAYYRANLLLAPAAEVLGIHKNTVRYRLQQAEELLGRPLTERRVKVEVALHCVEVYGSDVLPH
ncbi:MAG: helix-turn-helix domain-containing protein [Propionibacteriales bacterium]|nr:helix-turn-helix domain-containing protein [Propionibacteriales bacterium]